jgi:DNA-binding response OmpR family regulator
MRPRKILVVEDDPNINELIRITLTSPFHAITCVEDGADAMTKLAEIKPDLVLLDILIPKPDGWEIYKAIRTNSDLNHTRVIILTALLFSNDSLWIHNIVSTDMVMKKPFELDELRANARELLENR